jgi:putative transposase
MSTTGHWHFGNERHEKGLKNLGYAALCRELTGWRHDPATAWLAEAPIQPLQQALKDLGRAFENFFEDLKKPPDQRRFEYPGFKKKFRNESFRQPNPKQFEVDCANGRIKLPKLGWMRYRKSREVLGEVRNATVSLNAGGWYVSIQTRRDVEVPVHQGGAVGIDVGVARFATLSDGSHFEPLNSFKRHEAALAKAQRRLSRKVKYSNNWKKAKAAGPKASIAHRERPPRLPA